MVQFRRSKKMGPFRITMTQNGVSTSVGAGGFRIGKGADGKVRRTIRVPGTGIYDTKVVGQPVMKTPSERTQAGQMDASQNQSHVGPAGDEEAGTSIQEFLDLELPLDHYPVTNRLQKMIAEIETGDDDPLIDAVATSVVNLETQLVNTQVGLMNARAITSQLAAYAINLEARIIEAGIPIQSAQEEMAALGNALREDPFYA